MAGIKVIAIIIACIGALMALFPLLPGTPVIFGAMLLYSLVEDFHQVTPFFLAGMLLMVVLSYAADNLAAWWGARKYGAGRAGGWGALFGGLAGVFINPLVGVLVGPFFGAVVAELLVSRKKIRDALKVGVGTIVGMAGGSLVRFILALFMVIAFIYEIR